MDRVKSQIEIDYGVFPESIGLSALVLSTLAERCLMLAYCEQDLDYDTGTIDPMELFYCYKIDIGNLIDSGVTRQGIKNASGATDEILDEIDTALGRLEIRLPRGTKEPTNE
jgi:hypothetical protein